MGQISRFCSLCGFELRESNRHHSRSPSSPISSQATVAQCKLTPSSTLSSRTQWSEHQSQQHSQCLELVPPEKVELLRGIVKFDFEPSQAALRQRHQWFWIPFLCQRFSLPPEIVQQICDYCPDPSGLAVQHLLSLPSDSEARREKINLSSDVWASHVDFEGTRYIASLTNSPPTTEADVEKYTLVYTTTSAVDTIFVGQDHLGVRNIIFSQSSADVPITKTRDVWWTTIANIDGASRLVFQNDGIKLRSLESTKSSLSTNLDTKLLWSIPQPNPDNIHLHQLRQMPRSLKMNHLDCNYSNVTAYSACWRGHFFSLHAHTADDDYSFYNAPNRDGAYWLYFPLNKDELVTGIWEQRSKMGPIRIMVMTTNQGRSFTIGPQPGKEWSLALLDRPLRKGSRVYFNESCNGIDTLGFEIHPISSKKEADRLATSIPWSRHPLYLPLENCFYSVASLEDVVEITCCSETVRGHSTIIGILFRYSDGSRASIGQIRLDALQRTCSVDPWHPLYLTIAFFPKGDPWAGCPYVSHAGFAKPVESDVEALEISWSGNLEWWFSHCRSVLRANGCESSLGATR